MWNLTFIFVASSDSTTFCNLIHLIIDSLILFKIKLQKYVTQNKTFKFELWSLKTLTGTFNFTPLMYVVRDILYIDVDVWWPTLDILLSEVTLKLHVN